MLFVSFKDVIVIAEERTQRMQDQNPSSGGFKKSGRSPVYRWVDEKSKKLPLGQTIIATMAGVVISVSLLMPADFYIDVAREISGKLTLRDVLRFGVVLTTIFTMAILSVATLKELARKSALRSRGFIDIDYEGAKTKRLSEDVANMKKMLAAISEERKTDGREKASDTPDADESPKLIVSPLESHIYEVIKSLEQHIDLSDKKASRLLDTGTMYLRRGIYFYVTSIFVWQFVAHVWGVDKSLIFGVVSCSLTFLVVEFLAAWFLKQYRNFNDSSMQFMKVKSIFDRYLLSYHTLIHFSTDQDSSLAEARF
ncbi:hypothetical protein PSE10B_40380 [Pseudomonas amygdali pv. eriobotryae]|nr:hypothetical protein PSE10B_40380 [Pseudomonas amygdali pv. eriobotryae]